MRALTYLDRTAAWMQGGAPCAGFVISSRVRLARNVHGRKFPAQATESALAALSEEMFAIASVVAPQDGFERLTLEELSNVERTSLVERYLTSREHVEHTRGRGLIFNRAGAASILVNEEDHFRIQALCPGLQLESAHQTVNEIDDRLEEHFGFAFSPQYGYLTACPTNVGTGMRASAMMHLPALGMLDRISKMVDAARQVGLTVRGIHGEGSKADGNLYQVSNQITLGRSEEQIISEVDSVAREIVKHEQTARNELLRLHRTLLEDHVWRAFGILSQARTISTSEATDLLSAVRLGFDLGMLRGIAEQRFNELLVWIRPACLQTLNGIELDVHERDKVRATLLRNALSAVTAARP